MGNLIVLTNKWLASVSIETKIVVVKVVEVGIGVIVSFISP